MIRRFDDDSMLNDFCLLCLWARVPGDLSSIEVMLSLLPLLRNSAEILMHRPRKRRHEAKPLIETRPPSRRRIAPVERPCNPRGNRRRPTSQDYKYRQPQNSGAATFGRRSRGTVAARPAALPGELLWSGGRGPRWRPRPPGRWVYNV